MPTAKRLPSGSWRCQVYSHSIIKTDKNGNIVYDKDGKPKKKRIYESFTSDDTSRRGKIEAEAMANDFILNRKGKAQKRLSEGNMTLLEAIEKYIDQHRTTLSPTTIKDYETIKKNGFQDIMLLKLKDFDTDILQDAVNRESKRLSRKRTRNPKPIATKRLRNEYGLIRPVIKKYRKDIDFEEISLPKVPPRIPDLLPAETIFRIIRGTDLELAVSLAMWLSFTSSEIRGLTKSKSVNGDYITIREVLVDGPNGPVRKAIGKNDYRNRRHRIPPYIKQLIENIDGDILVPFKSWELSHKWTQLLKKNGLPHMTFHDLRHVNASVMALLRIPDKYAQERGGWKSDKIMKKVYQQTFSDERERVDDVIDQYFEDKIQHECNTKK
ncbi:MAG TPA: integrase [Candidatus Anaerostipes avistercoris]|uniref:Integrase n=1 Tax=Candidatus Anaerostipes avistercoris TaxID=2838462 RepID=A0A9D2PG87_9FIRM|nr:integrase [Candidatus Anaerostipes avistercoris]